MGYLSFDASIKVQLNGTWHSTKTNAQGRRSSGTGGIEGFVHHVARDVDRLNGEETRHSNDCIDPELTDANETYYRAEDGELKRCTHSRQLVDTVNRRVEEVRARSSTAIRQDAVIVRPVVTQVDEDSYDDEAAMIDAQIEWMESRFGSENIVGMSIHRDETSLHIHWLVTPVTERMAREPLVDEQGEPLLTKKGKKRYGPPTPTGELTFNQNAYFSSPAALAGMHKDFRCFLAERGFDIQPENKPLEEMVATWTDKDGNAHQKGLTPETLKEITAAQDAAYDMRNKARIKMLDSDLREKKLDKREAAISLQEAEAKSRISAANQEAEAAQAARERAGKELAETEVQRAEAERQRQALVQEMGQMMVVRSQLRKQLAELRELVASWPQRIREALDGLRAAQEEFREQAENASTLGPFKVWLLTQVRNGGQLWTSWTAYRQRQEAGMQYRADAAINAAAEVDRQLPRRIPELPSSDDEQLEYEYEF